MMIFFAGSSFSLKYFYDDQSFHHLISENYFATYFFPSIFFFEIFL